MKDTLNPKFHTEGGNLWYTNSYMIDKTQDSIINSFEYIQVVDMHIRQVGNQVFGIPTDSINEYLIMDFDAQVGGALDSLYSNSFLYNAVVLGMDSMVLNDASYHHFVNLAGFSYSDDTSWVEYPWLFTWHEIGLCHSGPGFGNELGGLTMNVPVNLFAISHSYVSPSWYTPIPLYNNPDNNNCENCNATFGSIKEPNIKPEVYPNPTTDLLNFKNLNQFEIQVIDLSGKQLLYLNKTKGSINVSSLQTGLYCIKFLKDGVHKGAILFVKE